MLKHPTTEPTTHRQIKEAIAARAEAEAMVIRANEEAEIAWSRGDDAMARGWADEAEEAEAIARSWGRVIVRLRCNLAEARADAERKGGSLLAPMAVAR